MDWQQIIPAIWIIGWFPALVHMLYAAMPDREKNDYDSYSRLTISFLSFIWPLIYVFVIAHLIATYFAARFPRLKD
jgi:hypothetical protein